MAIPIVIEHSVGVVHPARIWSKMIIWAVYLRLRIQDAFTLGSAIIIPILHLVHASKNETTTF